MPLSKLLSDLTTGEWNKIQAQRDALNAILKQSFNLKAGNAWYDTTIKDLKDIFGQDDSRATTLSLSKMTFGIHASDGERPATRFLELERDRLNAMLLSRPK